MSCRRRELRIDGGLGAATHWRGGGKLAGGRWKLVQGKDPSLRTPISVGGRRVSRLKFCRGGSRNRVR